MPLRCVDPTMNRDILSFDLSPEEWRILERVNKSIRHLRMPCCDAQVVLKKSRRGTCFFAHKIKGDCVAARETEAHRCLKRMAVEAARASGWDAETEVPGATPSGDEWRADVLAQKGKHQVAIEIQWSAQTSEETLRRQARYAESGVRCLWLLRQKKELQTGRDLPAARISGDLDEGFVALIPTVFGEQSVPMREFFDAAFNKRLRFGLPLGCIALVSVQVAPISCWSCDAQTRIITGVDVDVGPDTYRFTVPALGAHPEHLELFRIIRHHTPDGLGLGDIKRRYSKTQRRPYLSNGCAHCDALVGEFFERFAWDDEETVCEFTVRVDELWHSAMLRALRSGSSASTDKGYLILASIDQDVLEHEMEGWGVYSFG